MITQDMSSYRQCRSGWSDHRERKLNRALLSQNRDCVEQTAVCFILDSGIYTGTFIRWRWTDHLSESQRLYPISPTYSFLTPFFFLSLSIGSSLSFRNHVIRSWRLVSTQQLRQDDSFSHTHTQNLVHELDYKFIRKIEHLFHECDLDS